VNKNEDQGNHGVAWFLAAFGLLLAGVVFGAALSTAKSDFHWFPPVAGFVGYLLAFRRGMVMSNPRIDESWRHSPRRGAAPAAPPNPLDPEATVRLPRPDTPPADRSPLRVVR